MAVLASPLLLFVFYSSIQPAGPDTKALFAEINRGDALMKGLRKVTGDMKTHKNPELRAGGVVSSGAKKTTPPAIPARPEQRKAVVQPKLEQTGNKWNVVSTLISVSHH